MFRKRDRLAEDAEAARQSRALQIMRDFRRPVTAFDRKVAAIVRSRHVDPFKQLAVAKALPGILALLDEEQRRPELQSSSSSSTSLQSRATSFEANDDSPHLLPSATATDSSQSQQQLPLDEQQQQQQQLVPVDQVLGRKRVLRRMHELVTGVGGPTFGDTILLPLQPPVFAVVPNPLPVRHRPIETIPCRGPHASLYDFERLAFNNRTIHRYYSDTDFAAYLYQNLLYSLDASDVSQLATDSSWQARLAVLLWRIKLNQLCAFAAFYENRIVCDGEEHDTSFVPYYDVRSIQPLSRNRTAGAPSVGEQRAVAIKQRWRASSRRNDGVVGARTIVCRLAGNDGDDNEDGGYDSDGVVTATGTQDGDEGADDGDTSDRYDRESVLYYHRDFDPAATARVPFRHMGLFMVFPFKAGYYVRPDGRPVFLNVKPYRRDSVRLLMERVCGVDSLEAVVDSLSRQFDCEDALSYAVHSRDLVRLGVALLVLRRMVGDRLTVGSFDVQLPTEMNVLEWNHTWCREATTVLPRGVSDGFCVERQLRLIREIAARAANELAVSLLCSPYRLIECQLEPVFRRLANDAERYAFYTLLMQDYPNAMYWRARKQLRPVFPAEKSDETRDTEDDGAMFGAPLQKHLLSLAAKYPPNCRPYLDTVVSDRMLSYSEPLIRPTDLAGPVESHCQQLSSPERYEFVNEQLNSLVANGDVLLTAQQYAAYLSMYL